MEEFPNVEVRTENFFNPVQHVETKRVEERGQIKQNEPLIAWIIFEKAPVWLLALAPNMVQKIYVYGMYSFDHLFSHLTENKIDHNLYYLVINSIGQQSFVFTSPPADVDAICLISGSISFLNDRTSLILNKKGIFITENTTRCKHIPQGFSRLSHSQVGGASTYQLLYRYLHEEHTPKLSILRRSLGDFMDYATPPSCTTTESMSLTYKGKLPIRYIDRLVCYPTPFSPSGSGFRVLKVSELVKLFGLEGWTGLSPTLPSTLPLATFPLTPVHLLDALLQPLLLSLPHDGISTSKLTLTPPSIHVESGYTSLPQLQKQLPNDWYSNVEQFNISVKDDKAVPNESIWNKRITLVFPQVSVRALTALRHRVMTHLYIKLYKEFKAFIQCKYKSLWHSFQVKGRLQSWVFRQGGDTGDTADKCNTSDKLFSQLHSVIFLPE